MKDFLNDTGCGMCLAKWTQVTMHLGTGHTHSCHHPAAHKIPLEEIQANPAALHNTEFKKEQRKLMLNDKKPDECDYCWRIEDANELSDRYHKSLDSFSFNNRNEIIKLDGDEDVYPSYVEVSFSNVCNFKCGYCSPQYSSTWTEEINQHGPYKLSSDGFEFNGLDPDKTNIPNNQENPYKDAWWEWFPEAYKHMKVLRITGGEPLLSKDTMRTIDFLLENPNPELDFAINTNLCPPPELWEEFKLKIFRLTERGCVKKFTLFTSIENWGARAEYNRFGMDFNQFRSNFHEFLDEVPRARITIMAAFNIMSITSFKRLLMWVLELKKKYNHSAYMEGVYDRTGIKYTDNSETLNIRREVNGSGYDRVGIDIPYVRAPHFLDAHIATPELLEEYLLPAVEFMYQNLGHSGWSDNLGFNVHEADKLKRIFTDLSNKITYHGNYPKAQGVGQDLNRARFYKFVEEHDARRGTNFLEAFPEMEDFYNICKTESDNY